MENEFENISSREFSTEKKGYNRTEVKKYLNSLSVEYENKLERVKELEEEVNQIRHKLEDYFKVEKDMYNFLNSLKEVDLNIIENVKEQANEIILRAENKRDEIVNQAEDDAKSLRDTLIFLKEQQEILITRLKIIINNQEGMLNDFLNGENSSELKKTMAEAAAFRTQTEINIDSILEKLL